jgi:hypothetical protein
MSSQGTNSEVGKSIIEKNAKRPLVKEILLDMASTAKKLIHHSPIFLVRQK